VFELVHTLSTDRRDHRSSDVDLAQAVRLAQEGCISAGELDHQASFVRGLGRG
jgi:hypothetical protein